MTRVGADLTPEQWGALDRYAEDHDMTRTEAVVVAVARLTADYDGYIIGAGQMAAIHPSPRLPASEETP